jgi:hypothetical protein
MMIDPPHPLAYCKRPLKGSSFGETVKTEVSFHGKSGMIKIPPCSKALSIGLNSATLNW